MKRIISLLIAVVTFSMLSSTAFAVSEGKDRAETQKIFTDNQPDLGLNVKGAYLIEAESGAVLYSLNPHDQASPASVTKIMTLLLVCEALDDGSISLSDEVSISSYAASMGGSQVFLEEGEKMTVEELIKCTVIASANDAAVSLAETVSGSEKAFVGRMNAKAKELGLTNTSFENTTGLDDTTENHYSCSKDIAIMSRELIKHDVILKYSGKWQDTIRNGEFTLTNTNRLVRYYDGCNGLKTGSTDKAGYCVSTTAKRGNMQLIAVVMGAETRDERNNAARALLDYGFSSFSIQSFPREFLESAEVLSGKSDTVSLFRDDVTFIIPRSSINDVETEFDIPEVLNAPLSEGDVVGKVIYKIGDEQLFKADIRAGESVERIGFFDIFIEIIKKMILG